MHHKKSNFDSRP